MSRQDRKPVGEDVRETGKLENSVADGGFLLTWRVCFSSRASCSMAP